jgi:hypothetical protein
LQKTELPPILINRPDDLPGNANAGALRPALLDERTCLHKTEFQQNLLLQPCSQKTDSVFSNLTKFPVAKADNFMRQALRSNSLLFEEGVASILTTTWRTDDDRIGMIEWRAWSECSLFSVATSAQQVIVQIPAMRCA